MTISHWTRDFVAATTENERGETIARYTGWRAVLDPTWMQRSATWHEWELDIVADDQGHDCAGRVAPPATALRARATPPSCAACPSRTATTSPVRPRTAVAEQGFRVNGPWTPGTNGTLTAPLVSIILDPA